MTPHDEAGAILAHYLKIISRAAGLKWTAQNDADIARVADLLGDGGLVEIPAFDQIDEQAPARRPAAPGPRKGGIAPTTSSEDDKAYLRRLNAANGVEMTARKRGA